MPSSENSHQESTSLSEVSPASLLRRLGAILYDSLILFSIVFLGAQWFPLIPESYQALGWVKYLKQLYVLALCFGFFGWFWTRPGQKAGQTLGMRAWRLRVVTEDGHSITWAQALIRFIVAIFSWLAVGVGFLISLFATDKRTWHDRASNTRLVVLPKR